MRPEVTIIESMFRIDDKHGKDVDFKLNLAQRSLMENWHKRLAVPKARQRGVSALKLALMTVKCLSQRNTRAVVISHESDSTQRMLRRVHYYLDNLRGPKAVVRQNKNEIVFDKTNSVMYIGTAGARKFGRGDMITDLHASEVAYWPDPKELTAGAFQAVPRENGTITVESTGNGRGNWYHNLCVRASKGQSSFKLHFIPFFTDPEYRLQCTEEEALEVMNGLQDEWEEPERVKAYGLDAGQILFRRAVLEELDFDLGKCNQEYPCSLNDCFQAAGGSIFQRVSFVDTPDWQKVDQHFHVLKGHPNPRFRYYAGGDVSGGVGKDSSVVEVFCLETNQQVAEWISNRISPDLFGLKIAELGKLFNGAYMGVENNNHGIVTVKELKRNDLEGKPIYPSEKLYQTNAQSKRNDVARLTDLGFRTTSRTKPLIIGSLRFDLASGLKIHSPILRDELASFVEHEDGTLGAVEGSHDDTVIAAAVASFVKAKAALVLTVPAEGLPGSDKDAFSFETALAELRGRRNVLPFPREQYEHLG